MKKVLKVATWIVLLAFVMTSVSFIPSQKASAAVNFTTMPIPTIDNLQRIQHSEDNVSSRN